MFRAPRWSAPKCGGAQRKRRRGCSDVETTNPETALKFENPRFVEIGDCETCNDSCTFVQTLRVAILACLRLSVYRSSHPGPEVGCGFGKLPGYVESIGSSIQGTCIKEIQLMYLVNIAFLATYTGQTLHTMTAKKQVSPWQSILAGAAGGGCESMITV